MYSVCYRYDYIGTSNQDRCPKCGDCISWYRHFKDKNDVFFCQNCGYGFQMKKHRVDKTLPDDFRFFIEQDH